MKKILFTILLSICLFSLRAEVISPDEALSRLYQSSPLRVKPSSQPKLTSVRQSAEGDPTLYVFTYENRDGFLLLSADDSVPPLLGYSDENNWETDNLPPQLEAWLNLYSDQITLLRHNPEIARTLKTRLSEKRNVKRDPITPMVTASWDQVYPYNIQCPTDKNSRCLTGCVATAMAQVMYYWKYPEVGQGSHTYNCSTLDQQLTIDFSQQPFAWDDMLDTYNGMATEANRSAVAYLMKACGYSVDMDYSRSTSGAQSSAIPSALRNFFGYDSDLTIIKRDDKDIDTWSNLVYNELKYVGPVIYNGLADVSTRMGHCFVCDGYDTDDLFHFNWGWGGVSNGYYLLSLLNPSALGAGGGDSTGYIYYNDIITGITPPVGRLSVIDLEVANAASDSGNKPGQGFTYTILDPSDIQLSMSVRASGNPVTTPIEIEIYETNPVTMKNETMVLQETAPEKLTAQPGEAVTFTHSLNFRGFNSTKLYAVNVYYTLKGQKTLFGSIKLAASSGVETILTPQEVVGIEIYDVNGRKAAASSACSPAAMLSGLPAGIYIVRYVMTDGSVKTEKLIN